MRESVQVSFRFRIGEEVQWGDRPGYLFTVLWRAYRADQFSAFVTYGIQMPGCLIQTAYEPDLSEKGAFVDALTATAQDAPGAV